MLFRVLVSGDAAKNHMIELLLIILSQQIKALMEQTLESELGDLNIILLKDTVKETNIKSHTLGVEQRIHGVMIG